MALTFSTPSCHLPSFSLPLPLPLPPFLTHRRQRVVLDVAQVRRRLRQEGVEAPRVGGVRQNDGPRGEGAEHLEEGREGERPALVRGRDRVGDVEALRVRDPGRGEGREKFKEGEGERDSERGRELSLTMSDGSPFFYVLGAVGCVWFVLWAFSKKQIQEF